MKLLPRSYQIECVQALWAYFKTAFGNPICALPTGTGKSVVIAMFLESIYKLFPLQKVLVMIHVKELIAQNHAKLIELWPQAPAGIYSAGLGKRNTLQRIIFAGIASVAKRAAEFGKVDLVIVDECHLVSMAENTMYRKFFNDLLKNNPQMKIIGFTATYWRLGHGKITEPGDNPEELIFTDVAFDITNMAAFNRLIAEGFLCPLVPKKTKLQLDLSGVHLQGGEYKQGELQIAVDKDEITRAALLECMEYRETRKRWLIFASGIEHAVHIAEMLQDMGLRAKAVHSKMPTHERDEIIADLKSGELDAVVNNNILTTGFDCPEIDMIVVLRPTQSTVLWVQMLGRGTRPCPWINKENCLVLDFAGNTKRLGPINDPVVPRKKGKGGGEAPIKECPACECYVHASLRFCDGYYPNGIKCTHEFVFEHKLNNTASTGELIKGDLPVLTNFKIDHITFSEHTKQGRPPMMKVSYFCGNRLFNEYVCVEHDKFAGRKAREWMHKRMEGEIPKTTAEALALHEFFAVPSHVQVWTNKQYPEIMRFCFDGTNFGTEEASSDRATVDSYAERAHLSSQIAAAMGRATEAYDDDIPF